MQAGEKAPKPDKLHHTMFLGGTTSGDTISHWCYGVKTTAMKVKNSLAHLNNSCLDKNIHLYPPSN